MSDEEWDAIDLRPKRRRLRIIWPETDGYDPTPEDIEARYGSITNFMRQW